MRLVLRQTLVVFSALLANSHTVADVVEHDLADTDGLNLNHDGVYQQVLSEGPGVPKVPLAGSSPTNASMLIDRAAKSYLDPLPSTINGLPSQLTNLEGVEVWRRTIPFYGYPKQINITAPWLGTCRPVILGVKQQHTAIFCGGTPCSVAATFQEHESYQTSESFRIETTSSVGVGYGPVEASVSHTRERIWEKVWGHSSSTGVRYTWSLGANQRCAPSIAHVELDCTVNIDPIYYDSFVSFGSRALRLEHDANRKGGGGYMGQWCRQFRIQERPLTIAADWDYVLPRDRARGRLWKRPSSEMRQYIISGNGFSNQMVFISRERGQGGGDWQTIIGCLRDRRNGKVVQMTIPLNYGQNVLPGYVGCVA